MYGTICHYESSISKYKGNHIKISITAHILTRVFLTLVDIFHIFRSGCYFSVQIRQNTIFLLIRKYPYFRYKDLWFSKNGKYKKVDIYNVLKPWCVSYTTFETHLYTGQCSTGSILSISTNINAYTKYNSTIDHC